MDTAVVKKHRKPGRPKTGNTVEKYTVMLPPALHEWAMNHKEGLSGLVRRLLAQEHDDMRQNSRAVCP
jgi:hypothetical protein